MVIETRQPTAPLRVEDMFNSAVAAFAICAAWELGALDELHDTGKVNAHEFADRRGLDRTSTLAMFRSLAAIGAVERKGLDVTVGPAFTDVRHYRSFFHWLGRGSADLFRAMADVMPLENRIGRFYHRDAAAIAYACREINEITYEPAFRAVLDGIDVAPGAGVADLGCGGGARLASLLDRYPGTHGIGVDIAAPAVEVARANLDEAGHGNRATAVVDDALRLEPRPEFADVELVTCFMMGHDFWPRESCVRSLRRLREAFPAARRLVIGDATRTPDGPDTDLPVFTLGFEVGHDLMGTFIPTVADWESVFPDSGWTHLRTHRIDMLVGETIFELG
ncbi:class I SAM-dependent methyltransferase [Actinomadura flavalba]|uniref:class I SAM-dependent methyltransferase n=1 Tax=Actinomadura flavalba TaxID=1120938 RepID=UPI00036D29B9|nr:class I SAM-dependent methyltransferase [Actinomadura flavalba]